ncbi:MAG: ribosomal methyltransferase [Thermoleophilia bacterium]|nr:ribosomal methyltransferase [Thermoleophilia bacterium]MCZ4495910.1 ribosomal methyltransferase [Thermoleophilia bacterium]
MTAAGASLVEVTVEVAAEHAELAEFAVGEFSPGGFQLDARDDGGARFTVFLPAGDEPRLPAFLAQEGIPIEGAPVVSVVPDDWAERWKEFHQAITIGTLWVGPPWQLDDAPAGLKQVVIEPAQGFGTGAHPTTRLVLALLQDQPRGSVLDIGCGSGVLAVAAAKLGFGPITAIDNDPVAVESTLENIERNDVPAIKSFVMDALQEQLPTADLILANVIFEPLVRLAPKLRAPRIILSGLLRSQALDCAAVYEQHGYVLREQRERDGWAALVLEHGDPEVAARNTPVW